MKRALVFQHTQNEPLGFIEHLLDERAIPSHCVRLWETNEIPFLEASHLIILGGPMSANDEDKFPFLALEKARIRKDVCHNVPVLGLCLGAQLIAAALGAKVFPFVREIGWLPAQYVGQKGPLALFPDRFMVFQFHKDTFELPYGSRLLCTGEQVKNQAFRYRNALALQFHLEMTPQLIGDWCRDFSLAKQERIRMDSARYLADSNCLCQKVLEWFMDLQRH